MASWGVLPTGCTTRCHCSVRAESLQSQTQLRAGFGCPPPQRPLVSPGQQGSGMSHVRLLQRLAGDTLNVL